MSDSDREEGIVKVAMIGSGSIAPQYMKAIEYGKRNGLFNIETVAAVNRTAEGNRRSLDMGIPHVYLDVGEMIEREKPDAIFCLVNAPNLYSVAVQLIPYGIPILLEKPPGLRSEQTRHLAQLAEEHRTNVMVALNRRFYDVVKQAKRIIEQSGGLLGMRMDGFERFHWMKENGFSPSVLEGLLYTNTVHCIDLIRHYAGNIVSTTSFRNLHSEQPHSHRFAALLTSDRNVPITFQAYWHAVGNWCYELYVPDGKIRFANLETAMWERRGVEPVALQPSAIDLEAKPGFVEQLSYFVNVADSDRFYRGEMSLFDAVGTMELIERIDGSRVME